jgi:carbapenem resistance CarG-like protein
VTKTGGFCVLASVLLSVAAMGAATGSVLKLAYGINRFEGFASSAAGIVVLSMRGNGNAHGFDVASFYVDMPGEEERFSILPIFDHDQEKHEVTVGGGADCLLHDFRLVRADSTLWLIVATREFGDSYVDARPVTFDRYALKHNASGEVGRPSYFFEFVASSVSTRRYCDVGDAFKDELALEDYRPSVP